MVNWDMQEINRMISDYTNDRAWDVNQIAQGHVGDGFPLTLSFATPEQGTASIIAGPEGLIREYGTGTIDPEPWGITSLMEA